MKPKFGIGAIVNHPALGRGRVLGYEGENYTVIFKGGEIRRVNFAFEAMHAEGATGDAELDRIKQAVREVLDEHGWLDTENEMAKRWVGGTMRLLPGKEDTQSRDVPLEMFFKKIISIRDKLRVLEQKINAHPTLTPEEKIEFEGYITRCYGSLTTFNMLFTDKESQFRGQSEKE